MSELLLVTENCKGLCEHNFISTFDELKQRYMRKEDNQTIDNFHSFLSHFTGRVDVWNTFYVSNNVSLDMRFCVDHTDLTDFLSGKFNDSVEELKCRFPNSHCNDGWYWDNDIERFSPKAIDIINREHPESLAFIGLKRHGGKTPLDDIIQKATFVSENINYRADTSVRDEQSRLK